MGSCASKSSSSWWWWWCRKALTTRSSAAAAVHPWTPPAEGAPVPPGQRVTVRMRASEFRALAGAVRRSPAGDGGGDVVGRLILDGCAAGRWAWSPAPPE